MTSDDVRAHLARLAGGNRRFVDSVAAAVGRQHVGAVLSSADPFAVVLTCADSRAAPEILFGETLGQLFVVRVAGNVPGSAEIASIEYAVAEWSCPLVVVMGHTRCGAVAAALDPPVTSSPDLATLPYLASLLVELRANVSPVTGGDEDGDARWRAAVAINLEASAGLLARRSAFLATRVARGDLLIVRALYDVDTGLVEFIGLPAEVREAIVSNPAPEDGTAPAAQPAPADDAASAAQPATQPDRA